MSTLVPKREAPKPNGILNYARRFVHNKTKAKWSLDKIQAALEEKYPEKKWSIFMNTWKEHHPIKEPVVYTELYKKRLEQGYKDKDNNWYRSGEKKVYTNQSRANADDNWRSIRPPPGLTIDNWRSIRPPPGLTI